jgi:glycosyltransferase involved in cell wall biosynthesis
MAAADTLELTVIVASHNRREMLRRGLESLAEQTADPASFEVIVADDGSEDDTAEMAEAFEAPYPLLVLRLPKRGHAAAQNSALEHARAPRVLLLDDDMVASPELVAAHVAAHAKDPTCIGIGAITQQLVVANDWYAHAHAHAWNAHYEEFDHRPAHWTDCYGANLSAPRAALEAVGGVDLAVPTGKDLDLGFRLTKAGCTPIYLPDAHGVHDDQKRSEKMLADAARQGRMHLELCRRDPERTADQLDWSARSGSKELQLRRLLIALRVPPGLLARLGPLIPGGRDRELLWYSVVRRYTFWRGVREDANRREWSRIVHGEGDVSA